MLIGIFLARHTRFYSLSLKQRYGPKSDNASLSQTLQVMDALLLHYERNKKQYSAVDTRDDRMLRSINMGWFVLNKYYQLTANCPTYAAALLLDPSKRKQYIEKNWPTQ